MRPASEFFNTIGHEDAFPAVGLNGRCRIQKRSIAPLIDGGDFEGRRSAPAWCLAKTASLPRAGEFEVLRGRLAALLAMLEGRKRRGPRGERLPCEARRPLNRVRRLTEIERLDVSEAERRRVREG